MKLDAPTLLDEAREHAYDLNVAARERSKHGRPQDALELRTQSLTAALLADIAGELRGQSESWWGSRRLTDAQAPTLEGTALSWFARCEAR